MKITKEMIDNAAILNKMIELRNIKDKTKSKKDKIIYDNYLRIVFDKFSYIIDVHTNKYKKYANYQDLRQEGALGLFIALNRFDPNRSKNVFKLMNWYISTRIRRSAHKHDVIRFTLKQSKDNQHLNRVETMPVIIDEAKNPHENLESNIIAKDVRNAIFKLSDIEKNIVNMYFGIDKTKKNTISNICNQTKMSRIKVLEVLQSACEKLSEDLNYFNI
jgi:RNA polymerase sigma factor (sigma-70 family)